MTIISTNKNIVTLINVFTVDPVKQQQLVDLLIEATEEVMQKLPGYVSANIHKSLDGTKVTNYAQWRSKADFEAMSQHSEAAIHMKAAAQLAKSFEPYLYEVVFTDEGES